MIVVFKFTFKKSWLKNYLVKAWLKSLKKYKILVLLGLNTVNVLSGETHLNNLLAVSRQIVSVCFTSLWGWHLTG